MITRVTMPKFTKHMTHGTILMWKREEGEAVTQGDVIADIETETAIMELEAHGSGFLRHILATEGSVVKTGTMLAIIGDLDDDTEAILKEAVKHQKNNKKYIKDRPHQRLAKKNKNFSRTEEPVTAAHARGASSSKSTVSPSNDGIFKRARRSGDVSYYDITEETESGVMQSNRSMSMTTMSGPPSKKSRTYWMMRRLFYTNKQADNLLPQS